MNVFIVLKTEYIEKCNYSKVHFESNVQRIYNYFRMTLVLTFEYFIVFAQNVTFVY